MGESVTGHLAPSDCLETQPVAIESLGAVQVRNRDEDAVHPDDAGRQGRGRHDPEKDQACHCPKGMMPDKRTGSIHISPVQRECRRLYIAICPTVADGNYVVTEKL